MNSFKDNFVKVIDYSKNIENYNQEQLYSSIVDLRNMHGDMLGGFYKNLGTDLNNNDSKLELSFLDSMIDNTRKVLQLAESKFNFNNANPNLVMKGGKHEDKIEPKKGGKYDDYKNKPILFLFHADWCGHCHHFMPTFEKLRQEYVDSSILKVVKISDTNRELVEKYQIGGYPTIKLYDGNDVVEYTGGRDINNIREFVNHKLKLKAIKD